MSFTDTVRHLVTGESPSRKRLLESLADQESAANTLSDTIRDRDQRLEQLHTDVLKAVAVGGHK